MFERFKNQPGIVIVLIKNSLGVTGAKVWEKQVFLGWLLLLE